MNPRKFLWRILIWEPPRSPLRTHLTNEEALSIGRNAMRSEGYADNVALLAYPYIVRRGKVIWDVETDMAGKGGGVKVEVDDETGKVIKTYFQTR